MPRFFIQRVRFRPAGEERPDTPHAGYDCIISPAEVTGDPAVVHVRYEQLQPLLELWKLERPIELARRQFDAPERCRDPQEAFEHLLDLVNRKMDHELIQPGWYLAHVAQAFADLRCPRFDAVQLAGCERFFSDAFGQDGELNQEWLVTLAAEVARRSSGMVTIEEADELEFATHPPKPAAYLVVARGDEHLWCILRPWPQGIPLVTDEDLARERDAPTPLRDTSIEAQLIDLYNEQYAEVFTAATTKGRDAALQRDVASFLSGSTGLIEIFKGVTPAADGTVDSEAIVANFERARDPQKLRFLQQGLSELLDFLLFSAMESMDRASREAFERRVNDLLREGGADGDASTVTPDVLPTDQSLDLIDEFYVDDDGGAILDPPGDPPAEIIPAGDPRESQFPVPPPPTLDLSRLVPPPLPPSPGPGFEIPSPLTIAAPPASPTLTALCNAEGEAQFALEKLEQLAAYLEQREDAIEREAVLRTIEHIRTTLRELQTLHGRLFPQTHPLRRR